MKSGHRSRACLPSPHSISLHFLLSFTQKQPIIFSPGRKEQQPHCPSTGGHTAPSIHPPRCVGSSRGSELGLDSLLLLVAADLVLPAVGQRVLHISVAAQAPRQQRGSIEAAAAAARRVPTAVGRLAGWQVGGQGTHRVSSMLRAALLPPPSLPPPPSPPLILPSPRPFPRVSPAPEVVEKDRGEVALPERGQHHHHLLAAVLGPLRDLDGRHHRGAAADAAQQALLLRLRGRGAGGGTEGRGGAKGGGGSAPAYPPPC